MNGLQYYEEPMAASGCAGVGIRGAVDAVVPAAATAGAGGSIGSGAIGMVRGVSTEGVFDCPTGAWGCCCCEEVGGDAEAFGS